MRVLVVEGDETMAESLQQGLGLEGLDATRVTSGAAALHHLDTDVILLTLELPDMDGYELCRKIRSESDTPIIVVTARPEEVDRVVELELGAHDYVVRPFAFRELVARIRAVTRRTTWDAGVSTINVGRLHIDRRTRRVTLDDEVIVLTPKEFDLLVLLAGEPGAVFHREDILQQVWDSDWFGPTKTLDVHVASLRKKLGDPEIIETLRGVGFRLRPA